MQSIETIYGGYRFRSRLEAKWAVFFEAMGIAYAYEPEGFETRDGKRYLPDFRLSHINLMTEVKPDAVDIQKHLLKSQEFVMAGMANEILFLVGQPDFKPYQLFRRIDLADGSESWLGNVCMDVHHRPRWYRDERRLYQDFPDEEFNHKDRFSWQYVAAVYKARQARFGEPEEPPEVTRFREAIAKREALPKEIWR